MGLSGEIEVERRHGLGLPADVLDQLGLYPGDRVRIAVRGGRLVVTRVGESRVTTFRRAATARKAAMAASPDEPVDNRPSA